MYAESRQRARDRIEYVEMSSKVPIHFFRCRMSGCLSSYNKSKNVEAHSEYDCKRSVFPRVKREV
jgi:hypothetical protein